MRQIIELVSGLSRQMFEDVKRPIAPIWSELKGGNRVVRIKTGLIVGYLVVGLLTVGVFVPSGELNEIGADVRIAKTEVVGGWYFLVKNHGDDDWEDIVLTMNQKYRLRWSKLQVGQQKAFFFHRFKDDQEQVPEKGLAVKRLRIECSEGVFERFFSSI